MSDTHIIEAVSHMTGRRRRYVVPSEKESMHHSRVTHGVQYDKHEGKVVGGLPLIWAQMSPPPDQPTP